MHLCGFFLGGCDEKWNVWHPDRYKNCEDFVFYCIIWGLGAMLQVSNMNERIKEHIIEKIISYCVSSQLDQICDMKIDAFRRNAHNLQFSWIPI